MLRAASPTARRRLRPAVVGVALASVIATSLVTTHFSASAAETLLSRGRPAIASSVEDGGTEASNAVDGDGRTRWSSAFGDPQWIQLDLGGTATVTRVMLNWEAAFARQFTIEMSADGRGWTAIHRTDSGNGGTENIATSGTGRFIRLHATQRATQYGVSLFEFEVFGSDGGTQSPDAGRPQAVQSPDAGRPQAVRPPDAGRPRVAQPPPPPPANPAGPVVRVAEFLAECPFSHRRPDDPIVFPNMPGASHMHSFFGSQVTDAFTDVNDLANSPSNCNPSVDTSSYWVPTLLVDNNPVEPTMVTFYYLGEGVRPDVTAQIEPLPFGLRIVAGNAKATAADDSAISRWSCLHHNEVPASKNFVQCPGDSMMESYLDFPQCWNGRDLDSADHKGHMSYPVNGGCPSSHPVPVPKLRQVLRYPANGDPARFRLSSGEGFTMHGDFFNAWPQAEMERRVRDCIRPVIKCGANGRP